MPRTQSRPEQEQGRTVALVTLGCARNEVDSEELAGRLEAAGWRLVDDAVDADVAVVNTCGFVEQAKKDSIDTVLEAADLRADGATRTRAVVAVGCLAERYGRDLEQALPEADAVLGFDSYPDLASHLDAVLHGERPAAHVPRDRRALLPLAPAARKRNGAVSSSSPVPADPSDPTDDGSPLVGAPPSGPPVVRKRLDGRPWAPLKLASGCDRRCAFCAIPMFRGAFVSRRPTAVLTEAAWLADQGVREIFLVSENSTSYGKDLGDLRLLETVLPQLAAVPGLHRVRVSYLQPAEVRPGLVHAIATTPGVAPYFDLSFQHSSPSVLRRMRRFGGTTEFLALIEKIRAIAPTAGIRSNVIVGFPGETEADVAELEAFLTDAMLDVVGVFGYSDEDGTEAADLDGKIDPEAVAARVARVGDLVEQLTAQRALDRVGELVEVIVEGFDDDQSDDEDDEDDETGAPGDGGAGSGSTPFGRAAHQGPDVDGVTLLPTSASGLPDGGALRPGDVVLGRVLDAHGADLVAAVESVVVRAGEALVMEPVG